MRVWTFRAILLVPPVLLAAMAMPRLSTGLLLQRSFPATAYIETNTPLPVSSYAQVADILSHASPADAQTAFFQAEAAVNAGAPARLVIPKVEQALRRAPLSARGWIILASLLTEQDPRKAAAALTMAFDLAPHEYYLVFPRTLVGASLWANLPARIQALLLRDASTLAGDPAKRDQLRTLLAKPGGGALVTRAFAQKPDALRALNRSLALESLHIQ